MRKKQDRRMALNVSVCLTRAVVGVPAPVLQEATDAQAMRTSAATKISACCTREMMASSVIPPTTASTTSRTPNATAKTSRPVRSRPDLATRACSMATEYIRPMPTIADVLPNAVGRKSMRKAEERVRSMRPLKMTA